MASSPGPKYYRYVPDAGEQLSFHAAREIYRFRAAICGTGGGKTLCGLAEAISWAKSYPGSVGYIFEPSFPMVRRILLPTLKTRWLLGNPLVANPDVKRFNRGDMRLDWENGSEWWFVSLEDAESAEGPNVDYAMLDEGRLVRHFDTALKVILRRLRGSDQSRGYPTGLWITTTPDAPGSELHNFTENPKTRHPECRIFRWSIFQNPHLTKEYVRDIVATHHGGLAERFVHGRFAAVGVGTIPFDYSKHVLTQGQFHRNIIIKWIYGVDLAWTNPSCIIVIGLDKDGRAYVVDEFYQPRVTQDAVLAAAKAFEGTYGKGRFYVDPTQMQTMEWLRSKGLDARKSLPKRPEGIRHLAGYFPDAGDGQPRIKILSRCVNLIAELQVYDESKKEFDHAVDCTRYALGSQMKKAGPADAWILGP